MVHTVTGAPTNWGQIGDYVPVRELGRGGQAVVLLADDQRFDRRVALKLLRCPFESTNARHRFVREAEAAAKLQHPGICVVYEVGEHRGMPFLAMQLIDGVSLDASIRAAVPDQVESAGRTTATVLRQIEDAARALHAAHEVGLVHRDVKPGNLMIAADGHVVLLDFGLVADASHVGPALTRTDDTLGTPSYMAPEQIEPARGPIDRRSDVYSLGVTLYEALTSRRPFEAPTREALYRAILLDEPDDPARWNVSISSELRAVVNKAMEKSPRRRYPTALAFADDLRALREGRPVSARPIAAATRLIRWSGRKPALAATIVIAALGAVATAAIGGYLIVEAATVQAGRDAQRQLEVEGALQRGFVGVGEGSAEVALEEFGRALTVLPEAIPEVVAGIAMAHQRRHDFTAAAATIRDYPKVVAAAPWLRLLEADALRSLGRGDEAATIERGVPPAKDALARFVAGVRAVQRGDAGDPSAYESGLRDLREAMLLADRPRVIYVAECGHAAAGCGNEEVAREAAEILTARWPDSEVAWFWRGYALRSLDLEAAIAALRESIRLSPNVAHVHRDLAGCLIENDQLEAAIAGFHEAIRLNPNIASWHFELSALLNRAGRSDEATAALQSAVECDPRHLRARQTLVVQHQKAGRWPEALEQVRAIVELTPSDYGARIRLGDLLHELGRDAEAFDAFEAAIAVDPMAATAHLHGGTILLELGRWAEAAAELRCAVRIDPDLAIAHCQLGFAYARLGLAVEAARAFRRGHELGSSTPEWHAPSAGWVSTAEAQASQKEKRWRDARDDSRPSPDLAHVAAAHGRTRWAARAFEQTMIADPEWLDVLTMDRRFQAALAAARAAAGDGVDTVDLSEPERSALRGLALAWLERDLASRRARLDRGELSSARLSRILGEWIQEPAFACIRDAELLALLSESERLRCQALWNAVRNP